MDCCAHSDTKYSLNVLDFGVRDCRSGYQLNLNWRIEVKRFLKIK